MELKILLVDDHKIVRQGLRALIEKQNGFEVIGEAEDAKTAIDLSTKLSPHVIVMDIAMRGLNGIEATRQIVEKAPGVKVIGLSMHTDRRIIVEMLRAGAKGYVLKECAFEELIDAIRAVYSNRIYLSPKISDAVIKDYVRLSSKEELSVFSILTPRERQVLQLLAEGESTSGIAATLAVSVKTVETYRKQIMDKLDIHSVAELTKYAIREGIASLES